MEKRFDDNIFKKIFRMFHSMKFGIVLLVVIGVLSIIGTIIPQNRSDVFYMENYHGFFYELINVFDLGNLYSSYWYIGLMILLIINLFLCSIRRFIPILKRVTEKPNLDKVLEEYKTWDTINIKEDKINGFASDLGFRNLETKNVDGKKIYYKNINSMGYLGSWITHVSLIVIILAFGIGRYMGYEVFVYGIPGTVRDVEGTNYQVQIDDFEMRFDENMVVSQYVTSLTLLDNGEIIDSGQLMVNHPFRGKGINIYQNATGWALHAFLYKDDQAYKQTVLYNSEFFVEDNGKIALQFVELFPDFDMSDPAALRNLSPLPNNPVLLYALYYNGLKVDMGLARMGDLIEYEEYKFIVNRPEMYTLLQINHDPGITFAAIGGLLQIIGLIFAFYLRPKKLRIVIEDNNVWLWSKSYGNDNLYKEELKRKIEKWEGQ